MISEEVIKYSNVYIYTFLSNCGNWLIVVMDFLPQNPSWQ